MKKKITKAIFPVAGLGTRFLPATKASAKEMLPIVDKPLIQYAAEEAVAAGITELIFVTGRNKRSIEDHFDKAYELESELAIAGKVDLLEQARDVLPREVTCIYVRQAQALGLGHAVLCARSLIGDEAFAVLLADDLIDANPLVLQQMTQRFEQCQSSILGVERIAREDSRKYGVVNVQPGAAGERMYRLKGIVEKPAPEQAPSDLGVVGRYILTPRVFDHLAAIQPGAGGEIQLTDGIAALLKEEPVMAYAFEGTRFDCGSKLGYLKATVSYALRHPEVAQDFAQHLRQFVLPR
jgi:UTP--glucose-1-phosphate uridylyltransferase